MLAFTQRPLVRKMGPADTRLWRHEKRVAKTRKHRTIACALQHDGSYTSTRKLLALSRTSNRVTNLFVCFVMTG